MTVTKSHTATYKHRRVTIVTTSGERVTGKFNERRKNGRVILDTPEGKRCFPKCKIHQFLCGNGTRDLSGTLKPKS